MRVAAGGVFFKSIYFRSSVSDISPKVNSSFTLSFPVVQPKSSPPASTAAARWSAVSVFALASAWNYLDRLTLSAAAPRIMAEFHLTKTDYGWLLSAFSLSYTFASPLRWMVSRPRRTRSRHSLGGHALVDGDGLVRVDPQSLATGCRPRFPGDLGIRRCSGSRETECNLSGTRGSRGGRGR